MPLRFLKNSLPALLFALPALTSCGPAPTEEEQEAVATQESEILGTFTVDGATCNSTHQAFFRDAMFVARTIVGSKAFDACVRSRVASQYRRCTFNGSDGDPNVSLAQHTLNALDASRSANDVASNCDASSGAWGYAGVGSSPGYYGTEQFAFANASMQNAEMIGRPMCTAGQTFATHGCREAPYPDGLREVAATVIHENLHQHGYTHSNNGRVCQGSGYSDVGNSLPWVVDQCLVDIVLETMSTCGDLCPTRSGDDLTSCRTRGRLRLVDSLGSGLCTQAYDPGLGHVGALQLKNNQLVALDMLPHGQNWGGPTGGAVNRSGDLLKARGDFDPHTPGEEMIFDWYDGLYRGWHVASWDVDNTALTERTGFRGTRRSGDFLPHFGDGGTDRWQLYRDNVVLGVGRYSSVASWGASLPRDELFVRDPNGFGVLAVVGNLVTRNVLPWGTVIGGVGNWTLGAGDQLFAQGDFNGDGQKDIVLRNSTHTAIITRTGAGGTFRTLDVRSLHGADGWWGFWNLGGDDQVLATGDFIGDAREEMLIRSGWGIALLGMPVGSSVPRDLWGAAWGTVISSRWTLRTTDTFQRPGHYFVTGKKQVLLRGTDGLATLRWTGTTTLTASIPSTQHMPATGAVWPDPDTGGFWAYGNTTDQILASGDFDGDGFDQFVIRSGWGLGVIGRTASSSSMIVHDANGHGCGPSSEVACHSGLFGSWLSRDTDRVLTTLADGNGADTLILRGLP